METFKAKCVNCEFRGTVEIGTYPNPALCPNDFTPLIVDED